ncbi:MAG: hypothetical protein OCD01_14650 [Fibrobacterales bacterium]
MGQIIAHNPVGTPKYGSISIKACVGAWYENPNQPAKYGWITVASPDQLP